MTTKPRIAVKPGQVWADADPRSYGRKVRIVDLDAQRATVEPVSGGRRTRVLFNEWGLRGYRLVFDAPTSAGGLLQIARDGSGQDVIGAVEAMTAEHGPLLTSLMTTSAAEAVIEQRVRKQIAAELEQQAYKEAVRDVNGTECVEAKVLFAAARMVRGGGNA